MNEQNKTQFAGTGQTKNRIGKTQSKQNEQLEIENQNTRTLMQALHGCRKNCAECHEEEKEWEEVPHA